MFASENCGQLTTFIVTVDTEADNEWERQTEPTYENIRVLPAFQELCDDYGVRPTYLVTYDVAADRDSSAVLRELLQDGKCEIGVHMHGWTTPPFLAPLDGDRVTRPYLYQYPREVQAKKLCVLTQYLEGVLQTKMTAHRAGRWGLDAHGLALLEGRGYEVDTSVTPLISWKHSTGACEGDGGPDFLRAPTRPYYPSDLDVLEPGGCGVLEVPVSVRIIGTTIDVDWGVFLAGALTGSGLLKRALRRGLRTLGIAERIQLRPVSSSTRQMVRLCERLIRRDEPVINVALHSSELLVGGSPRVSTVEERDRIWESMEAVFVCTRSRANVESQTLTEYAREFRNRAHVPAHPNAVENLRLHSQE